MGPMTRRRRVKRGEDRRVRNGGQRGESGLTIALGARTRGVFEAVSRFLAALGVGHGAGVRAGVQAGVQREEESGGKREGEGCWWTLNRNAGRFKVRLESDASKHLVRSIATPGQSCHPPTHGPSSSLASVIPSHQHRPRPVRPCHPSNTSLFVVRGGKSQPGVAPQFGGIWGLG